VFAGASLPISSVSSPHSENETRLSGQKYPFLVLRHRPLVAHCGWKFATRLKLAEGIGETTVIHRVQRPAF